MDIPVLATLWYARSQRWGFHLYPCSSARQTWIDPNRSLREGKWERMSCCKLVLWCHTSCNSLRKHPFLLALRETSPAAKSEEKRMFSQATHVKEHCSGVYTVTAIEVAHKAIRWSWRTLLVGLRWATIFPGFLAIGSLAAQGINSNALNALY